MILLPLAITIDDLPEHGPYPPGQTPATVTATMLEALGDVPATGFVNGARGQEAVLRAWRAAGRPIGNHGWAHLDLEKAGTAAFVADAARNEPLLERLMPGGGWRWFRYPYLHEGRGEAGGWLAARGYRVAPVTMSFGDYRWTAPYARCATRGDARAIRWMERAYLDAARRDAADARATGGGQVLLLHAGAFTAHMLPRLIALYRREGFGFAALDAIEPRSTRVGPDDPALDARLDRLCR